MNGCLWCGKPTRFVACSDECSDALLEWGGIATIEQVAASCAPLALFVPPDPESETP